MPGAGGSVGGKYQGSTRETASDEPFETRRVPQWRFGRAVAVSVADLFSLSGKVAFVTGAGQGLGRSMAAAMAEAGASVVLFERDAASLAEVEADLARTGAEVLAIAGDVTDAEALAAAVDRTVRLFGRLDVVIANAGVSEATPGLFHELPREDWDRVVDVNLGGVYNTLRPALGHMVGQGSGKLILIASMFGLVGAAGIFPRPAYAATKGAVVNLTRELALEYAPHGIQVNAILPGFFRTRTRPRTAEQARAMAAYTPLGRIADADEIKGATIFLASPASDFMTGQMLVLDGGVLAR